MKARHYIVVHKHNEYNIVGCITDTTLIRTESQLLAMWAAFNKRNPDDYKLLERSDTSCIIT